MRKITVRYETNGAVRTNERSLGRMTMKSTRRVQGHSLLRSLVRSHGRTAHSFAYSALLAPLARSAALIRSLARSLTYSGVHEKEFFVYEPNASITYDFNPVWSEERVVGYQHPDCGRF